jgi:O-methyltransferase
MNSEIAAIQELMSENRARGLQEAVYYCYGSAVEGDLVEFGTMTGDTAGAIARAMLAVEAQYGLPARRLDLFDSFVGLPQPTAGPDVDSPHVRLGHWAAGGCKVLDSGELASLISEILPSERFRIVPGWFSESVGTLPPETRYGFVHIDCDLYQSTIDALDPLFQRGQIATGTVICFDDWMCNRASDEFGERRAFQELAERYRIAFVPWGSYTWSGARFIIRDYERRGW